MKDSMSNEQAEDLYRGDRYIDHNPSLHEEDSPWKVTKILPLVDQFVTLRFSKKINLLAAAQAGHSIHTAALAWWKGTLRRLSRFNGFLPSQPQLTKRYPRRYVPLRGSVISLSFVEMKTRHVLVTGSAGFISYTSVSFVAAGCRVTVIDDLSSGVIESSVSPDIEFSAM
jgi:hypothetical protein